ncbi:GNAT family N-acetyltransferase [Marisediminicola senii]|uniref:GNAT family N-acetyltransferase n=1 Tax=Marisediminicola senii TaxID=2711233 RepID=UPI0013EB580E|nr:GNAT family N-acetyltransferase [Marisediminicola senii]
MKDVTIRPTTADDWQQVRDLRLEMLRDTPEAYVETVDAALQHNEAEWRMRGERGTSDTGTALVAIDHTGRWVGTMRASFFDPAEPPMLLGVYVAPSHRGRGAGVADALLDQIEDWAAQHADELKLSVHENNDRARAFYERRGYTLTGHTEPYPLDVTQREFEMSRKLTRH